jgi:hypothetical protein
MKNNTYLYFTLLAVITESASMALIGPAITALEGQPAAQINNLLMNESKRIKTFVSTETNTEVYNRAQAFIICDTPKKVFKILYALFLLPIRRMFRQVVESDAAPKTQCRLFFDSKQLSNPVGEYDAIGPVITVLKDEPATQINSLLMLENRAIESFVLRETDLHTYNAAQAHIACGTTKVVESGAAPKTQCRLFFTRRQPKNVEKANEASQS